jgi:hypothetical protein
MGYYYTIRLDPKSSEMCTIIFPWGKYSYQRLPMGFGGSADIFQAQMMDLMASLEYVRAYIDDLLIITRGNLEDHLSKIETVLTQLRNAGLKVNAAKSFFCTHEIEYLSYTDEGRHKATVKESTDDTRTRTATKCQRVATLLRNGTILPRHVGKA